MSVEVLLWVLALVAGATLTYVCRTRARAHIHKYTPFLVHLIHHQSILMLQCDCGIAKSANDVRDELEIKQLERLAR